jgi:antitoxin component YwqK of YwqJK toxin-antitoxin module
MKEKLHTEVTFEVKAGRTFARKKDFYENGILALEGTFSAGAEWEWNIPSGVIKKYHRNGNLKSEEHFDETGSRDGECRHYNDKGEILRRLRYINDKLISEETFEIKKEPKSLTKRLPSRKRVS